MNLNLIIYQCWYYSSSPNAYWYILAAIGLSEGFQLPVSICNTSLENLTNNNSQSLSKDEDGFKTFVKRKRPPKIGKKTTSSLKAVKPLHKALDIFVTRLHPSTSEEEIAQFVKSQFVDAKEVSCSSLKTRHNSYASFKISFSGVLFKNCLDAENWPEGVLVKRYYPPNSEKVNSDTYAESGSNLQHD